MLRTVIKGLVYLMLSTILLAGNQNIDIDLALSYPGATQQMIGEKMVIDLGFLEEGSSFVGNTKIEVGVVTVRITQHKTSGDDSACILNGIDFDAVNIDKLKRYSERVSTVDKIYIGNNNKIILSIGDIKIINTQGDITSTADDVYFVDQECLIEGGMEGIALTELTYSFKLYAEIEGVVKKESVISAIAQDSNGIGISIRNLIENQINNSITTRGKRRK